MRYRLTEPSRKHIFVSVPSVQLRGDDSEISPVTIGLLSPAVLPAKSLFSPPSFPLPPSVGSDFMSGNSMLTGPFAHLFPFESPSEILFLISPNKS